ncbi:hypothetical protein [Fictibacillus sp. BK138]|uniref:hypothetical protein n=1 Tax=Fictibacillus sp. BK138 TaxID=2512121 RepID=UPI00102A3688|nr:hypothetical protein [Fictibacillus sp. BK138]RZT22682.1 hypothetical protein EV282_1764 [Fictibacillus sp. BK138]
MDEPRFIRDLNALKKGGYIKEKDYLTIVDGYHRYTDDLKLEETLIKAEPINQKPVQSKPVKPIVQSKPKIELTPEQKREKNITSLMAAGVILLLLGGLTLATSNWEVFSSLTKTMLVGGIAVLFGGLGALSEKVLKIRKTAFTFFVLFALFIPITILSAGYFELFGSWLSFYGEGRYVLGVLTTVLCVPVYFGFGRYFHSKLFSWITFIASSIGYAYVLLALGLTKHAFYFAYAFGNVGFIALYHMNRSKQQNVFLKILPVFIQANLILSTVLILVLFDNQLSQSFNIILTAILYLAMRMVNQRKEYEFIFIGFISYGLFQLIQNSFLFDYSLLLVVMIPIVLLLVGKFSDNHLTNYYQLANAAISVLSFIFITVNGVLLSVGGGSIWLFLGYLVLSGNFIYLSYQTTFSFFKYLAPFYVICTFMELYHLMESPLSEYWGLAIGISAALAYGVGQFLKPLQRSSLIVGGGGILLSFLMTSLTQLYLQAAIISLLLVGLALRHYFFESGQKKRISAWLTSLFLFSSVFYAGMEFLQESKLSLSIVLGSIVLLGLYILKKNHVILSAAFISVAVISAIVNFIVAPFVDSLSWVKWSSSILMMVALWFATQHFKVKAGYAGIQFGLFFALFYTADLAGLSLTDRSSVYIYIGIAFLLFVSGELFKRVEASSEYPIKAVSHFFLLLTIGFSVLVSQDVLPFTLLAILYGMYMIRTLQEYELRFYFYSGLTMLALAFHYFIFEWLPHEGPVIFSVLLAGLYFILKPHWKDRIVIYIVPFSLFFLGEYMLSIGNNPAYLFLHAGVLIGFILFYQSLKGYWKYATSIILVYLMVDIEEMFILYAVQPGNKALIWFTAGLITSLAGLFYNKKLLSRMPKFSMDVFAVFGVIYFSAGLTLSQGFLSTAGLLLLAILFYLHSRRLVEFETVKKILQTISSLFAMFAYYSFIDQFEVPAIIQAELNVLPWILLSYVINRKTWNLSDKMAASVQYSLLGLIAALLMIDAIQSYQVMDAIILGTLSFVSIIYGFISRQKSYFFIGMVVLLLNVLIQTRPYWGNMPWWVYLLLTGILLIGFASFNEFKKQKGIETPPLKEVLLKKWNHWFGEWK